jgi:tetratricopeptide (TPR) repeat protein
MQVASVIGRDFAFRILQTITGMKEELKSHLINLQGLEFIYEKQLFPELEYIFKHILTQEVAYNSLLTKRRNEIHENIGAAIETIYTDRLEEFYEMLAYHYSKAESHEKAAHYLKLSGIKAVGKHSPWEAFQFYKNAIKEIKQLPESEDNKRAQIEVSLLMYFPMMFLGQPEGAVEILQEGGRLSKEVGDERSLVSFYGKLALHYHQMGDPLQGIEYGETAFQLAEKMQDIELMAATAWDLYNVYFNMGEATKVVELCSKIIDLLEKNKMEADFCGTPFAIYPVTCAYYGYFTASLGDFAQGKVFCEKGLHTATKIKDIGTLGITEVWSGFLYSIKGDGTLALNHFENSVKYCEEVNQIVLSGYAWGGLGQSNYLLGEFETARNYIEKGIDIENSIGVPFMLSWLYAALSLTYFDLGDNQKALSLIEGAVQLAEKHYEKAMEGYSRYLLGMILGKSDSSKKDEAEESILKGINILEELGLKPYFSPGYLYLGEFYADIGQKEKALENLKKAERMFKEMGMDYWLAKTQEVLKRL